MYINVFNDGYLHLIFKCRDDSSRMHFTIRQTFHVVSTTYRNAMIFVYDESLIEILNFNISHLFKSTQNPICRIRLEGFIKFNTLTKIHIPPKCLLERYCGFLRLGLNIIGKFSLPYM